MQAGVEKLFAGPRDPFAHDDGLISNLVFVPAHFRHKDKTCLQGKITKSEGNLRWILFPGKQNEIHAHFIGVMLKGCFPEKVDYFRKGNVVQIDLGKYDRPHLTLKLIARSLLILST